MEQIIERPLKEGRPGGIARGEIYWNEASMVGGYDGITGAVLQWAPSSNLSKVVKKGKIKSFVCVRMVVAI
jgi:hypothetical protein